MPGDILHEKYLQFYIEFKFQSDAVGHVASETKPVPISARGRSHVL